MYVYLAVSFARLSSEMSLCQQWLVFQVLSPSMQTVDLATWIVSEFKQLNQKKVLDDTVVIFMPHDYDWQEDQWH